MAHGAFPSATDLEPTVRRVPVLSRSPGRLRLPDALLQPAPGSGIPGTGHEGDDETGLTIRRRVRGRGPRAHAAGPRPRRPSSSCRPGPAHTAGPRGRPTWRAVVGCGTRAIGIGPP